MDLKPGKLLTADLEKCCPSTGSELSAYREDALSAVTRFRAQCGAARRRG